MLFSSPKINTFALKKDDYISVSLEITQSQTKTIKNVVQVEEEVEVIEEAKEVDIDDLFSDVWTKDIKKETKKIKKTDNKRLELLKNKIKIKKANTKKAQKESLTNNSDKIADNNKKSSSGDEVNEYLAKIQAIVYKYFHPPNNSQGHTVKAVIELDYIGKVIDFRILTYSSNQALNKECDMIKDRLSGVLFPKNPDNLSFSTIVNITSDKN